MADYSFIPQTVYYRDLDQKTFVNVSGSTITNGSSVLGINSLTDLATALGDDFSADYIDMRGRYYPQNGGTDANVSGNNLNSHTVATDGDECLLPCLKWSKMPWLRMVFYINKMDTTNHKIGNFDVWFYDADMEHLNPTAANPICQCYLQYYDWTDEVSNVYHINEKVSFLHHSIGTGFLMFYDDMILMCGQQAHFHNNSAGSYSGYSFLNPDKTITSFSGVNTASSAVNTAYVMPTESNNVISFEKIFNENYPEYSFDGILCEIRGQATTTQVVTYGGVQYLIIGGIRASGSYRSRQATAISAEILG